MKKAGTILIYNCSGPEFSKMRQIFAMLHLLMRQVTPEKYEMTLLEVADGTGTPLAEGGEPIEDNMLVFCGLHSALLRQVLEVLRLAKLPPIPYKAVLTVNNKDMNSKQLYEELRKERAALQAAKEEALKKKEEGEAQTEAQQSETQSDAQQTESQPEA